MLSIKKLEMTIIDMYVNVRLNLYKKIKLGGWKMLRNTLRRNKGITLIALVVTIIVLLILAGISIAMLTGQNRNFK